MKKWVPDRVPISPQGIRGPAGARKRKIITTWNRAKKSPANFGLNRSENGLNCPEGASRTRVHAHTRYIMCTPKGCTYGCPLGHPLEPGARRADERQKEKRVATYNGHPKGVPICMPPQGACINGVGALPTPYGPTLRGAHNGPSGLQK